MRFSALIWKNLLRRPFRTALTLTALTTAIAAVVALLGIAEGFQTSFRDVYRGHGVDVVVSRHGAADRLSSTIPIELATSIDQVPGISRTAVVLLETLSLENEGVYGVPAMGIDADSWMLGQYDLQPANADLVESSRSFLLGRHLADRLEAEPGQTIELFESPYRVAGIFTSRSTWENGSMVVPLAMLQELTGREAQVTYVNVVLEPGADLADMKERIEAIDAKLLALATDEFVATDTRMRVAGAMAWMTSMIAIVIGAIATLNTMMTSVLERTGEIGILRAVGWSRRRVVAMIIGESCWLAGLAAVLGVCLAIALTWLLSQSPTVRGVLATSIDASVIAKGVAIGLAIGLLGALLPAWRASRMMPSEAFRSANW